jgi:hypothetical protein
MTTAEIESLDAAAVAARHAEFARFERGFTYPLGADRFHIDHGADYLAFFRGLGEPVTFAATLAGELVGVLVAVLRRMPEQVWYACDLKVAERAGGRGLARRLLRAWAREHLSATPRAFGVSMNPASGDNRLARLAQRCPDMGVQAGPSLGVYSFDFATWQCIAPAVTQALGPLRCYDPRGRKDIVLASNKAPMPLLHLQHGANARADTTEPRPGCVHMLCLPQQDVLVDQLRAAGVVAGATASVLHVGMTGFDWRQVLTSDI